MAEYAQILDSWNRKLCNNEVVFVCFYRIGGHAGQYCSGFISSGAGTGNWWRHWGGYLFLSMVELMTKSLRLKLLCKSCLILMDVFAYHQVHTGIDLDLCS